MDSVSSRVECGASIFLVLEQPHQHIIPFSCIPSKLRLRSVFDLQYILIFVVCGVPLGAFLDVLETGHLRQEGPQEVQLTMG